MSQDSGPNRQPDVQYLLALPRETDRETLSSFEDHHAATNESDLHHPLDRKSSQATSVEDAVLGRPTDDQDGQGSNKPEHLDPSANDSAPYTATPSEPLGNSGSADGARRVEPVLSRPPSSSTKVEHRERLGKLLRGLQRLAQLRMNRVDHLSLAKEKGRLMRNLQQESLSKIAALLTRMRQKASGADANEPQQWDVQFNEIETFLAVSLKACEDFDLEQKLAWESEWDMCALEDDIYRNNVPVSEELQKPMNYEKTVSGEGYDPFQSWNLDHLVRIGDLAGVPGPDPASPEYRARGPLLEHLLYSSESEGESWSPPAVRNDYAYGDDPEPAQDSKLFLIARHSNNGPAHERLDSDPEAISGEGDQFVHVNFESAMEDASNAPLLQNGSRPQFTKDDLQTFTAWLLNGTPWNEHLVSGQDKLKGIVSNLDFLRLWMLHVLENAVSETTASTNIPKTGVGRTASEIHRLVRGWMWDPHDLPITSAGPDAAGVLESEPLEGQAV